MEAGEIITFSGAEYVVTRHLYKSWGSDNQTLSEKPKGKIDHRKSYYVVMRKASTFWVKEWVESAILDEEYKRMSGVQGVCHEEQGVNVRAVKVYDYEDGRILMENLLSYVPLSKLQLGAGAASSIKRAVRGWVKKSGLEGSYDLHPNNVMVSNGKLVVLVDFEMATGRDRLEEMDA